jgi:hypothetical protein
MIYLADEKRHLVCWPYSVENLHRMAEDLNIKRCWFHGDDYDIPKTRIDEILSFCFVVNTREIVKLRNTVKYERSIQ